MMNLLRINDASSVGTVVVVNLDTQFFDWLEILAKPEALRYTEQAHDKQIEALCQLLDNLTLPYVYMTERPSEEADKLTKWLKHHGLPLTQTKIYMRASDDVAEGHVYYTSVLHLVQEQYGLPNLILIDDGLNLEMHFACEEQGWLHLSI